MNSTKKSELEKIQIGQTLIVAALLLPIAGLIAGQLKLLSNTGLMILPSGSYTLLASVALLIAGFFLSRGNLKDLSQNNKLIYPGIALLFIFFISDWIDRSESLIRGPSVRGEILLLGLLLYFISRNTKKISSFLVLFLVASCLALISIFIQALNGEQIFSDDHATFFFRLSTLNEVFPNIPFYNPLWNAGTDERAFFATGSLNIFFLSYPIVKLFGLSKGYNYIIASLAYILPPISIYSSSRILQMPKMLATLAAILCLAISINWYQWLFTYGTLGFMTSLCLSPLVLALGIKIIDKKQNLSPSKALLFVLCSTLVLFWSAAAIAFVPLFIIALFNIKNLLSKKLIPLILIALICLNAPWMYAFWKVSNVGNFITKAEKKTEQDSVLNQNDTNRRKYKHKSGTIDIKKSINTFRKQSQSTHPLILFLALPGILLLPRSLKAVFISSSLWLISLATIFYPLKPQLELDRMFLVASYWLCLPTANTLYHLLKSQVQEAKSSTVKVLWFLPCVVAFGYLLITPFNAGAFATKRNGHGYSTKSTLTKELSDFIEKRNKAGRILFSGCVVHDLDGGHLVPLSIFNKQAFVASSQVGNLWWYTDVFPYEYLKDGEAGRERFLDLYNISGVFAHERKQKDYYNKNPNYQRTWVQAPFAFYERLNFKNNYFLSGHGEILDQSNYELKLKLSTPKAVIKFKYFPFLEAGTCKLSPYSIDSETDFVQLENCPIDQEIILKSTKLIKRLSSNNPSANTH